MLMGFNATLSVNLIIQLATVGQIVQLTTSEFVCWTFDVTNRVKALLMD
jgi:hypothetical protein